MKIGGWTSAMCLSKTAGLKWVEGGCEHPQGIASLLRVILR